MERDLTFGLTSTSTWLFVMSEIDSREICSILKMSVIDIITHSVRELVKEKSHIVVLAIRSLHPPLCIFVWPDDGNLGHIHTYHLQCVVETDGNKPCSFCCFPDAIRFP